MTAEEGATCLVLLDVDTAYMKKVPAADRNRLPGRRWEMWRSGIPWKCHPAVDLHRGKLDALTIGLGSEKRTTVAQER